MGFLGENGVGRKFSSRSNFYVTSKITVFCRLIILVVSNHFFVILKNGVFCEMVILVVFKSF